MRRHKTHSASTTFSTSIVRLHLHLFTIPATQYNDIITISRQMFTQTNITHSVCVPHRREACTYLLRQKIYIFVICFVDCLHLCGFERENVCVLRKHKQRIEYLNIIDEFVYKQRFGSREQIAHMLWLCTICQSIYFNLF